MENEPIGPESDIPEGFTEDNVIYMDEHRKQLEAHSRRLARVKENETVLKVRDWTSEHKTITIVGSATAIGLAITGLYGVRKKRKSR